MVVFRVFSDRKKRARGVVWAKGQTFGRARVPPKRKVRSWFPPKFPTLFSVVSRKRPPFDQNFPPWVIAGAGCEGLDGSFFIVFKKVSFFCFVFLQKGVLLGMFLATNV